MKALEIEKSGTVVWYQSLMADASLIVLALATYLVNSWYVNFLSDKARLILVCIAILIMSVRVAILFVNRRDLSAVSHWGLTFFSCLYRLCGKLLQPSRKESIFTSKEEQTQFLFVFVKLFYIPLMTQFVLNNINDVQHEVKRVMQHGMDRDIMMLFNNTVFPIALTCLFLVDTVFFFFGYLFESKLLNNKVRSVESTWSGWIVALICYPPFNDVLSRFTVYQWSNYSYFDDYRATFAMRFIALLLLIVYVAASVFLGRKCSNLTNRGIVSRGVYGIVRHPAYISKVLFWWVLILPLISSNVYAIISLGTWSFIYFLRALTEERHLLQDPDYVAYCQKVRYRFIPGLY
jgi:protein-S-isoprenylcysteine O-methyltransferase Ste14